LQHIINEVVDLLGSSAKIKNITINHTLPENIMIYADKNMLKTIMQNLISNAVKFTNPDGIIRIHAIQYADRVEINVSDTGIGISKKMTERLFEIETNVPTSGTFNEPGSGLGLIICREFVEKHGGKIWVESKKGKGSNFKFNFPVKL
jgi:signal transduction histidine kinase